MCDQQSLRSACAYAQSDQSLCLSLEYSMTVKLLNEHHLEFLSLKGGCRGWSESTLVKIPHCWKSHVTAHISLFLQSLNSRRCGSVPMVPSETFWVEPSSGNQLSVRKYLDWYLAGHNLLSLAVMLTATR